MLIYFMISSTTTTKVGIGDKTFTCEKDFVANSILFVMKLLFVGKGEHLPTKFFFITKFRR